MIESNTEKMARLRAGFAPRARALAAVLGAPSTVFGKRLPAQGSWFIDDDVLAVVGGPHENQPGIDLLLAYGLAWAQDRDLWLILPEGRHAPTLARLPWIDPHVRLLTFNDADPVEQAIPPRATVLKSLGDPLTKGLHNLKKRDVWVADLVAWLEDPARGLVEASRGSYRAWHIEGRQILRIERTRSGLRIVGGVNYSKPVGDQRPPVKTDITGPLTTVDLGALQAAVEWAIARRLDGSDDTHLEHRLQSRLKPAHLQLDQWDRERPAVRAGGALGFVDFLGVDTKGRVHVVETKIGPDPMLVLQGLDYWIWATAHRKTLSEHFERQVTAVAIDYVVAPKSGKKKALSPYTKAIATALDGGVSWRFWTVGGDWATGDPSLQKHPVRTVPDQ